MTEIHKLPSMLKGYSNTGFVNQQRVKFLFYLCIALIITLLLLISLRLFFYPLGQIPDPAHAASLLPLVVVFFLFLFYLFLLVRGYFKIASVLVPVTILLVIWFNMIFHDNQVIARLNTVAYVFMVMAMLPVLVQKHSYLILFAAAGNVLAVIGFTLLFKGKLNLSSVDFWDYIIDNSVALAFVGLVGFYMNRVYLNAIEQAQIDELQLIETKNSLIESEVKYREMIKFLPQIIFELDLNGRVNYLNQIGHEKLGYSSDAVSKDILVTDFIVEKEVLLQNIEKSIRGELSAFKYTAIKRDGTTFPVQVFSNVILRNGEPVGLRGIAIDLTDEVKAQKAIRESEERFSLAFKSNPAPMAISEIETGRFIDINEKWAQLIGYSREEHIGRTSSDLNYWLDINDRTSVVQKLKKCDAFKDEILTVRTKSGAIIKAKWSAEIITLNDEKVMLSLVSDETYKLKAEEALRESEERFSVSFKSSPAPLIISDIETGRIIDTNEKWVQMLGYSYSEQIGRTTRELDIFVDIDERTKLVGKLKSEGFLCDEHVCFNTKYGDRIIAKWSAEMITLKGEKVMLSLITNETERVRAEELLIASERKFKETLRLLPQTVYEADLTGQITYINKAGTEMFGYRPEDVVNGVNVTDVIAPEDYDKKKINFTRLLDGEMAEGNQYLGLRKDGSTFPMQIYSKPIIENDIPVGYRGIIIDLTEIKKVENELRQSNELFKTLINSSPISITLSDLQGKILVANNVFSKYVGQPLDYIIGKTAKELRISTHFEDEAMALSQLQEQGYINNFETNVLNHKGEKLWLLFSAQEVNFSGQRGILQTTIDITDRKLLEEELKKYTEQLEFLVKQRTEELEASNEELSTINEELYTQRAQLTKTLEELRETQEQLIQTEKMASIGILTAGVAHEINNPINYIYNGAMAIENHLAERSPENLEALKPLFDAISTGIQRITGIVKSLSKYSRKDDALPAECNVHEVIDNALVMLYNQYKKRINITKDYSDRPPLILANEGALHQVFLNLLINAIHAISEEGTIEIRTKVSEGFVEISIKDSGIGIQPENQIKIFDPFFTTKDPGKGTGLGLSITKRIILENKGSINCYSEPGKGTEFVIILPQILKHEEGVVC